MAFQEKLDSHFPTRTVTYVVAEGGGSWTGEVSYAHYGATVDTVPFDFIFDTLEEIDGRSFEELEDVAINGIEAYFEWI